MECFLYDDQLDRCAHYLFNRRRLEGNPRRSNASLCLCSTYHLGWQHQFNMKNVSFSVDYLFFSELLQVFGLALANDLFSYTLLRRRTYPYLCYRIGHYLLSTSTPMVYRLTSLISIERLNTTIVINGQCSSHCFLS